MHPDELAARLIPVDGDDVLAPPDKRAAVAVILRGTGSAAEVLLMERVQHERDPWSGQVSFPGGTREPEDDDLHETARRETFEEVELDLRAEGRLLGRLPTVAAIGRGGPVDMDITPYVFHVSGHLRPGAGPEVEAVFWLPLVRVLSGELDGEHVWRRDTLVRRLPCWHWEGRVIWGLTHRMLGELLGRLDGRA